MRSVPILGVLVAAVGGFITSGIYYSLLSKPLAVARGGGAVVEDRPWVYGAEFARTLLLSVVMAGLVALTNIDTAWGGAVLGASLWVGFPVVLWVGAVIHERTPVRLAAIHAGDWLFKLVTIGAIIGAWR